VKGIDSAARESPITTSAHYDLGGATNSRSTSGQFEESPQESAEGNRKPQSTIQRALEWSKIDFAPAHRPPSAVRVVLSTMLSIGGSLLIDALLVSVGTAVFPSTKGYAHFQFSDYAKLTVIGVVIACAAWPVVTRISSSPRWLFLRLAILVTLVLYIPDLWLLAKGQPAEAVFVLMTMHLAIALVTYNVLVHVSPVRPAAGQGLVEGSAGHGEGTAATRTRGGRHPLITAIVLVVVVVLALTTVLFVWPATDSPHHVDAILSLNGPNEGAREAVAVSLAKAGYARVLLFSRGGDGNDTPCPKVHGVLVVCFDDVADNTRGEARFAAQYAQQHQLNSLMIVPGRSQATRAHLLLERCFTGRIVVVPASQPLLGDSDNVLHEWAGVLDSLLINRGC
jgi:uncharacterized SAM-binding protein YcdF (DUF218 family)